MYIFRYNTRLTGALIGYHASTFCQTVQEASKAKRYSCKTPEEIEEQRQTILNNLKHTLDSTEENPGFAAYSVKQNYFKDLKFEDIELVGEEVPDVEIDYRVHTIYSNGNVTSGLNITLKEALTNLVKDVKEGAHAPEENKL